MPNPVIIDDGGSTRIKKLVKDGMGEMESLFKVNLAKSPADASEKLEGPYQHIKGVALDEDGQATVLVNQALKAGDSFQIESDNGQGVKAELDKDCNCTITVHGAPGNPPMIEAKQFRGRRRYVVANAGPIQAIEGTVGGGTVSKPVPGHTIYTTFILK